MNDKEKEDIVNKIVQWEKEMISNPSKAKIDKEKELLDYIVDNKNLTIFDLFELDELIQKKLESSGD